MKKGIGVILLVSAILLYGFGILVLAKEVHYSVRGLWFTLTDGALLASFLATGLAALLPGAIFHYIGFRFLRSPTPATRREPDISRVGPDFSATTSASSVSTDPALSTVAVSQVAPKVRAAALSLSADAPATMPTTPPQYPSSPSAIDEDHIYDMIAAELEAGQLEKGLWTRLFAESDGDETQTRVLYIKHRARRLFDAERMRLDQIMQRETAAAEALERVRILRETAARRIREDRSTFATIQRLAREHRSNPRMVIEEKARLLALAGGAFQWIDGYGQCSARFTGEEKRFPSGIEFSTWFNADVVPFLLSVTESK